MRCITVSDNEPLITGGACVFAAKVHTHLPGGILVHRGHLVEIAGAEAEGHQPAFPHLPIWHP
ncbi:protein of unknown function [Acidithiobacillus ferrivorans]|uniref:Uncharacterized protein n=1 Tax=Acidithiobacillus ferrivorans TaxID=160808 RepID=A0ABY1MSE6_9PROT|nr:protein of unknown function [Acidithiobacillus ferrivorans]